MAEPQVATDAGVNATEASEAAQLEAAQSEAAQEAQRAAVWARVQMARNVNRPHTMATYLRWMLP